MRNQQFEQERFRLVKGFQQAQAALADAVLRMFLDGAELSPDVQAACITLLCAQDSLERERQFQASAGGAL